jgi:hypothetical protein
VHSFERLVESDAINLWTSIGNLHISVARGQNNVGPACSCSCWLLAYCIITVTVRASLLGWK